MIPRALGAAGVAALVWSGCGGLSTACSEEDLVARQIERDAIEDHISTLAICIRPQSELEAEVGHDRALVYLDACRRLADLRGKCDR
jgi:hypothetical protein